MIKADSWEFYYLSLPTLMDSLLCLLPALMHSHNLWHHEGNIAPCKKKILLVITSQTVYPRQRLIIAVSLRLLSNSLVTFMNLRAFMHTCAASVIMIAV